VTATVARGAGDADKDRPEPVAVVEDVEGGAVRVIRFNRPEARNAFNRALYRAVTEALEDSAASDAVHAVVLTGSGEAFSAGQDLKEMAALVNGDAGPAAAERFRSFMDCVCGFAKPLLAAVNGVGVGLGFTLLAHCDLVLVAEGTRLRVPFAELGVPAEAASSYLFPKRMGWQRAAEILLTGRWISAEEAVAYGIALRTCPATSVVEEAVALAVRVAAGSPAATSAIKTLMLAAERDALVAARAREDEAFARLLGSDHNTAALDRFGSTGRLS
jgi:enoyl-CoA hydratase/carnithine racemase